ncbi:hypothetical protein BDN70DRAFT_183431 [Pholiota conissans]|uniref:Uncharacterized protein n=1 Tax=Pholiota conissans TaxID=109636 RepID=A0A9P5YXD1_9AGAR|nr:hypothetical protein BDN70DRAFT_183431 [Pholiota conissans]
MHSPAPLFSTCSQFVHRYLHNCSVMASTPPAITPAASSPALWLSAAEEQQPLLEQHEIDDKHELDNSPVDLGMPPRGLGPIQLGPDDVEAGTVGPPARRFWKVRNVLEHIPEKHRSVLRDMGKGCLYIIMAPIGLVAVTLYACGLIIEGIALLLKGVGSLGGSFLMRRNERSQSPTFEAFQV